MSMQNQLPVIRNPLVIPEILENIFSYLPTTALVRVTYVSKLWRLETRNKLYQNRNEIIYDFHKWFLNIFRLNWGIPQELMPDVDVSIAKVKKFRDTFQLNIRAELLIKRVQLQGKYTSMGLAYNENFLACVESHKLFHADPGNIVNYANFRKLDRECILIQRNRFNLHRELVNFEHYLINVNIITDPNEVDIILDKCSELQIEEEEMQWNDDDESETRSFASPDPNSDDSFNFWDDPNSDEFMNEYDLTTSLP
nr:10567_t:CDS:1 [Entrophospora candida]